MGTYTRFSQSVSQPTGSLRERCPCQPAGDAVAAAVGAVEAVVAVTADDPSQRA
jgi:hypothetical protein